MTLYKFKTVCFKFGKDLGPECFILIVTKSIPDLMEEDDTPLPVIDDSFLFDNLH